MKFPSIDLCRFLPQSSMFPRQSCLPPNTSMYISNYIKSKPKTKNCEVENNMEMIFATEK